MKEQVMSLSKLSRLSIRALVLVIFTAFFVSVTQAQFKASIQGTVMDPQGNAVPGAKVTVMNPATAVSRGTVASAEGFYRIGELAPSTYTVTVEAGGFKKYQATGILVQAEQPRGFDVKLDVGGVTEQVTVTAAPESLQTESANVATTFSNEQIERLPQFGRDPYELVRLAPGVFGDGSRTGSGSSVGFANGPGLNGNSGGPGGSSQSIFQTENQQPVSANGQRETSNDYTVDGVSVNSLNWGGAAVLTPNQESVQEITVLSNTYSADDGRNSGAHVKVVSKGGTNRTHGSGFFKYQSPGLNAFNKYSGFNPGSGFAPPVRVDDKFRQFGGSLGGAVVKDKVFYFFSYEGLRNNGTSFDNQYIDSPQLDQALASLFPNTATSTIMSAKGIAPRIAKSLIPTCALWNNDPTQCQVVNGGLDIGSPAVSDANGNVLPPGSTGQPLPYGNYVPVFSTNPRGNGLDGVPDLQFAQIFIPSRDNGNQYNARVDYVRGKNAFALSTYLTTFERTAADGGAAARPMADFNSKRFSPTGFLSWTTTISSTMVNEARFNFTRFGFDEVSSNSNLNFGLPRIEIEGMPLPGGARIRFGAPQGGTTPGIFAQNTFSFKDTFSEVVRTHALKYGFDWSHEQNNNNPIGGARPLYVFHTFWNFFTGAPIFEAINVDPRTGAGAGDARYYRTSYYAGFIQDDWKFRPNLTFNIGLRYDYFSPITEAKGLLTNLVLGTGTAALSTAVIGFPSQMTDPDRNNFVPRLGFAWSPSRFSSKMVWRGGFGVAHDRIDDVSFINSGQNPPYFASFGFCCGTASNEFGSPFVNGSILYATGSTNSPLSYPANPVLAGLIDPTTNLPKSSAPCCATIWGDPRNMPNPYVYSYSLEMQYALPRNWVTTVGYQGSDSKKLLRIKNLSYFYSPALPGVGGPFFPTPDTTASYNSLNLRTEHRFSRGYQLIFDYRYSKSMDDLSSEGPGFATNQTFPTNLAFERGPSDYDATHFVRVFGLWDLPIARGRNDWIGKVAGGWQINGIFTFHSGFPWTPVSYSNCFTLGGNFLCPVRPISYNGKAGHDASTSALLPPTAKNFPGGGVAGGFFSVTNVPGQIPVPGVGRNSFRGPRYSDIDLSIVKQFGLPKMPVFGESSKFEFRANFYNAFNKLNLAPFQFGSASTDVNNPQFGTAQTGLSGRVIEFQARLSF
jgi:hypothetical protein